MTAEWRRDRGGAALRGENPAVLRRLPSGLLVDRLAAEGHGASS